MDFTKMHRISCGSECAAMKRGTIDPPRTRTDIRFVAMTRRMLCA